MQENYGKNDSFQYIFGDFILKSNGVLIFNNKGYHIPPKEFSVITLLLNADGEVVTKEEIIDKVWSTSVVSDESLTRCIYALRKILHERKQCKYIETVYGRGYRFTAPIVVVTENMPVKSSTTLAVFPFRTEGSINIVKLHYELVQGLSKYSFCGLDILPASVTNEVVDFSNVHQFISQANLEYYIMGQVVHYGQNWRLFVELIHAKTHKLIEHQSIDFNPENPLSILSSQLINILIEKIPNINLQSLNMQKMQSLDSAVMYMNGRIEMNRYTPDSLRRAMDIFMDCISMQPYNTMLYCCLAECYISLTLLGLYNQKQAISAAMAAVEKALDINPSNSRALGLLGLIIGLRNKHSISNVLFKQAHLLKPNSPDIYYYNALFCFLRGDINNALALTEQSISLAPNKMGLSVLKLFILYYTSTYDETLSFASTLNNENNNDNPVVSAMIALLMALKGHQDRAKKILARLDTGSIPDYISVNALYTKHLLYGDSAKTEIMKFLANVNASNISGITLPLILTAYGKKEFDKRWQQLLEDNDIWSHVLINDPRISGIKDQIKHTEVEHCLG